MNVCEPLRKSTSDSKNNLGEIHKSHGLDWAFHSLSHYFLLLKHNIFFFIWGNCLHLTWGSYLQQMTKGKQKQEKKFSLDCIKW